LDESAEGNLLKGRKFAKILKKPMDGFRKIGQRAIFEQLSSPTNDSAKIWRIEIKGDPW
jgi:hypothetical protein